MHSRAITILKNCRAAIAQGGKLLLIERVLPNRVEQSITAQGPVMSDLNMMVISGGRERTLAEHRALIEAAGFTLTRIIPT